ncbi:MAG: ATP-binding protein [Candidatus Colwellbacteria bacterium]|nr:ATP-binding protein [Candidatus Colwellbacteria bacterium]
MPEENLGRSQEFVEIKNVRDGVVFLKNGGLRRLILVDGLNFDLKSQEEQDVITYAYQNFLNSLDFPIQVSVHSRKLNIDDYLKSLEEREAGEVNGLLKSQIAEYRDFIKNLVQVNAIMVKSFFIVVPLDSVTIPVGRDSPLLPGFLGGGKTGVVTTDAVNPAHIEKLGQRAEQVITGLRQIGLRAVNLEDSELFELLYNFYNPRTVEKRSAEVTLGLSNESIQDKISPASVEVSPDCLKIGDKLARSFFILNYPRYLSSGWFSSIINFPALMDVSLFFHPTDTGITLRNLRKKAAEIESQIADNQEKGMVRDPALETAIADVESLRDSLMQATEKLFNVGAYITIYADSLKELNDLGGQITNIFEGRLIDVKPANFEQVKAFASILPLGLDRMGIHSPLNSGPASSFFPFVSLDLTSDEGVLYGVNRHNNTLIIFDRFSLENANMVVFAKAGAGKSYASKLEIIRSLILGTDVLVIDPENEYQALALAVGGSIFKISLDSEDHINPFEIPIIPEDEEPGEVLKSHIVNLSGLMKLMLGEISAEEEALLDRAITETYASKDITPDKNFSMAEAPLLEDFEAILRGMEGGRAMAERLYRFTKGSYAGFANKPTNIDIKNRLIVFSIRDLEEELRPIAMYVILNYIWNLIRAQLKKRLMMIDEAWLMMKYPDSASFLFGLAKRARKYYLGITTITQDVEDFLASPYGKPIITNSSLQLLLKQSPASIDVTTKAFNLTDVEKNYILEADVGQGLFIAGLKRAAIQIIPSAFEHHLITTNPEEILEQKKELA